MLEVSVRNHEIKGMIIEKCRKEGMINGKFKSDLVQNFSFAEEYLLEKLYNPENLKFLQENNNIQLRNIVEKITENKARGVVYTL